MEQAHFAQSWKYLEEGREGGREGGEGRVPDIFHSQTCICF